ncbi:MAG: hypothetical protein M1480_19155 [Bacteroidetes bacterium]|nr:hypothetical protein [Bacteroidota bacterium]
MKYVRKISHIKRNRGKSFTRTVSEKYVDINSEELFLYHGNDKNYAGIEILFLSAAELNEQLEKVIEIKESGILWKRSRIFFIWSI